MGKFKEGEIIVFDENKICLVIKNRISFNSKTARIATTREKFLYYINNGSFVIDYNKEDDNV